MNLTDHHIALTRTKYTPDIAVLEQKQHWLLFVCDNHMTSGKNHEVIAHHRHPTQKRVRGFTADHFTFFQKRTDGTGIPMPADRPDNRFTYSALKIKGEVHAVTPECIRRLDEHYQNGVQFKRVRVKILYPQTPHGMLVNKDVRGKPLPPALQGAKHFLLPERVDPITCYMYVGMRDYWTDLLDGGFAFEPVPIRYPEKDRNWLPKYYHYLNRPG